MRVETVTVNRGGVAVVINESDFDPSVDKLAGEAVVDTAEQDSLIDQLGQLGIRKNRRTSVEVLRTLLDEELAK